MAWGDISLLEGCDGAAMLAATDGSGNFTGFSDDILTGAPPSAVTYKSDGNMALQKLVGAEGSKEAREWELGILSPTSQAFIMNEIQPVIATKNGRFQVTFFTGSY
jgi:hypothetical protein